MDDSVIVDDDIWCFEDERELAIVLVLERHSRMPPTTLGQVLSDIGNLEYDGISSMLDGDKDVGDLHGIVTLDNSRDGFAVFWIEDNGEFLWEM